MNPLTKIRDRRDKATCWQEKQALRRMRDHFKGNLLVNVRSLYLALTEWASDHYSDAIRPSGGLEVIYKYSGLNKNSLPRARDALLQLGLIEWHEIREAQGYRMAHELLLLNCPDRTQPLISIPAEGFKPKLITMNPTNYSHDVDKDATEEGKSLTPESLSRESLLPESGIHYRSKEGIKTEDTQRINTEEKSTPSPALSLGEGFDPEIHSPPPTANGQTQVNSPQEKASLPEMTSQEFIGRGIQGYERIRGVRLAASERSRLGRDFKLLYREQRTLEQVIGLMEWLEKESGWPEWSSHTLVSKIADFVAGRLQARKKMTTKKDPLQVNADPKNYDFEKAWPILAARQKKEVSANGKG